MIRNACILLVCCAPAAGGDFRFADLGETCDHVIESEIASGSVQIPPKADIEGLIAFNAQVFGMQTEVVYFCAGGLLFTGNYDTPLEEADAALRTFRSIYDEFNQTYGAPALDNTPWYRFAGQSHVRRLSHDIRTNPKLRTVSRGTRPGSGSRPCLRSLRCPRGRRGARSS